METLETKLRRYLTEVVEDRASFLNSVDRFEEAEHIEEIASELRVLLAGGKVTV